MLYGLRSIDENEIVVREVLASDFLWCFVLNLKELLWIWIRFEPDPAKMKNKKTIIIIMIYERRDDFAGFLLYK